MTKALREAKLETSWTAPDAAYEEGVTQFVRRILDPVSGRAFIADLLPFAHQIARIGAVNGLAQTLLKLTVPGVPDSYQGTELWDLSLVDPDNRRPVDFELRRRWLADPRPASELVQGWRSGRIKQQLIARTLALRKRQPALFRDGDYLPLTPAGAHAERIVAFARRTDQALAIVIVPRLIAPLLGDDDLPLPPPRGLGGHLGRAARGLVSAAARRADRPGPRVAALGPACDRRDSGRAAGGAPVGGAGRLRVARVVRAAGNGAWHFRPSSVHHAVVNHDFVAPEKGRDVPVVFSRPLIAQSVPFSTFRRRFCVS